MLDQLPMGMVDRVPEVLPRRRTARRRKGAPRFRRFHRHRHDPRAIARRRSHREGRAALARVDAQPFFVRFVRIFQHVAGTLVDDVDNLDNIVDPTVAPPPVLRYMGSWLGIESLDEDLDHAEQRRIVRQWGRIIPLRGTRAGLERLLGLVCAGPVSVSDNGGPVPVPIDGAPAREAPDGWSPLVSMRVGGYTWLQEGDLLALLRDELPAHVRFSLTVGGKVVWPRPVGTQT